ncbi:MAG: methionine--tRNA ligase [Pseudomonadota bacterium]
MSPAQQTRFYITTAISYPNGAPHIGHAYEMIATDALARFKRLDGYDVHFLTGTDEHGQKMVKTARDAGVAVEDLAQKNAAQFRDMASALNISNDDFIRTTELRHHAACQALWERMAANQSDGKPDIYKDSYSGWYSVRDEAYYAESETELREDGVRVGPQGTEVEWIEEESYFFRLSAYEDRLLKLYEDHPEFIAPGFRRNEITSFVKGGLRDLSVSRTTFDWGIKVPGDEKHVMYVWVDALTNYITALGFPDENAEDWQRWPADVHIIGKDIVRFHTVYWPAFLMSAGLPLPKRVFGHGFLFNKGEKMSKSLGNVVSPFDMADLYGVDALRFFLLREVPFGQDGSYSHEAIVNRINADLANDLGNLAQRSLSMVFKNCGGQLEKPEALQVEDEAVLAQAATILPAARNAMDEQAIHEALNAIWNVVGETNRYFAAQEPWALKKTDPKRMADVLWVTAEIVRRVAVLAQPFVPESASRLLEALGVPEGQRTFAALAEGHDIGQVDIAKPEPVFPRFVEPGIAGEGA